MSGLSIIPLELAEANALVRKWHRHHKTSQGHRFSLGVIDGSGRLHGAAIVGRPVARQAGSPRDVLEVVRLVTDGHPHCCSILYAAAARTGATYAALRLRSHDDDQSVVVGPDLVPQLTELLLGTLTLDPQEPPA